MFWGVVSVKLILMIAILVLYIFYYTINLENIRKCMIFFCLLMTCSELGLGVLQVFPLYPALLSYI